MYFTSRCAQDEYTSNVLYDFERVDILRELASTLVERMFELTDGRSWMAAHIRRGDFVRYHFTMESSSQAHIDRVTKRLADGRLNFIRLSTRGAGAYDVPGAAGPDLELHTRAPPHPGDKQVLAFLPFMHTRVSRFYIATDERDPAVLDLFRRQGAVLMDDLLTPADRRHFAESDHGHAWALMVSDVRGVVEQLVLARAAYFHGYAMSFVPGRVVDLRAARGADPTTALVD